MDYPKFEELNPANCREVSIRIHYPEFYDYLKERYKGKQLPFAEMLYLFYHNLDNPPTCCVCGGNKNGPGSIGAGKVCRNCYKMNKCVFCGAKV